MPFAQREILGEEQLHAREARRAQLSLQTGVVDGLHARVGMAGVLYPEHIDWTYARLKECGEGFLVTLPDFHG